MATGREDVSGRKLVNGEYRHELREFLRHVRMQNAIPGISVTVAAGNQLLTVCVGSSNEDTGVPMGWDSQFRTRCLNSLLIGLVAAELSIDGQLDLEAPVERYLPECRASPTMRRILVRHLLAHTGGYQVGNRHADRLLAETSWSEMSTFILTAKALFQPGAVFTYTYLDQVILSEIILRAVGEPPLQILKREILAPLITGGHSQTHGSSDVVSHQASCSENGQNEKTPRGGEHFAINESPGELTLSTMSLALLMAETISRGQCGRTSHSTMRVAACELARAKCIDIPRGAQYAWNRVVPIAYGLGCAEYPDGSFGNSGASVDQCCAARVDLSAEVAVAVGLNGRSLKVRDVIMEKVLASLRDSETGTQEDPLPKFRMKHSAEFVGRYEGITTDLQLVVRSTGSSIVVHLGMGGGEAVQQFNVSENQELSLCESSRQLASLAFFRDPVEQMPCIMYGLRAFRLRMGEADSE